MKKRFAAFVAALILALAFATPAQAQTAVPAGAAQADYQAAYAVQIFVDGEPVDFGDTEPFVVQGSTLAPMAPLYEKLNIRTDEMDIPSEDGDALTVTVGTKLGLYAIFVPESPVAEINYQSVDLPVPALLVDGELYIPVRVLAEAAGYNVQWDGANRTVFLERKPSGEGFIWEVKHDGVTVYLVGSIHLGDDRMYPLPLSFEAAYDVADVLGFEVDLRKALTPEGQAFMLQAMSLQDGTTLKDHVTEETYRLIGEKLAEFGLPENAFDTFKPWAAAQSINSLVLSDSGITANTGIEMLFLMGTDVRKLPVIELESMEYQVDLFDRFPPDVQENLLLDVLGDKEALLADMQELLDIWLAGDDAELAEMADAQELEDEEYYRLMLLERNINMTEKIKEYLEGDEPATYLIVIGALHMVGKDGIVTMLEEDGYSVVRR
jgi:hypothetical protein